jgi:hypothetical protein
MGLVAVELPDTDRVEINRGGQQAVLLPSLGTIVHSFHRPYMLANRHNLLCMLASTLATDRSPFFSVSLPLCVDRSH